MLNDGIITLIRIELRKGHCRHFMGALQSAQNYNIFVGGSRRKKISVMRGKGRIFCSCCSSGGGGGAGVRVSVCLCILLVICHQVLPALKRLLECLV